ncbi:tectonin beta-propeller repeat-containing protein 1 [Microdochium nivale]|nr:tectonin beta-propeller repeat-containing protein 1 [Microdochium nivale]
MRGLRSSRRVESLQDADIDHEILIIDHDAQLAQQASRPSAGSLTSADCDTSRPRSTQPLVESQSTATQPSLSTPTKTNTHASTSDSPGQVDESDKNGTSSEHDRHRSNDGGPSIVIDQPTPNERGNATQSSTKGRKSKTHDPETAIDILYENERGCILCGVPLFSAAALGNLDPSAWTNFAHKPSPTDIKTAQVPDPSWQWSWPEWRVNHDDTIDTDADGWEYSFMFSKKFSWHGPKWYNSYVRRRAWIRGRVKKGLGYQANDPHLMHEEYFQVTPKQKPDVLARNHNLSRTSSVGDRLSLATLPRASNDHSRSPSTRGSRHSALAGDEASEEKPDIHLVEELMLVLRISRIDREKLEAVENYIKNSEDGLQLDRNMHEIMSVFVFQASRKLLLTRLMQVYDELVEGKGKERADEGDSEEDVQRKKANLGEAIKHADEEVRKLEYWSDIKSMAENGESGGAVESSKGWKEGWEGLDKSGA